jgi:PAS domain S-box-containing protein
MGTFYVHNISNLLVFVGLCVMVSSIFISLTIHKAVSPEIRQKWVIISTMMISFSVGYSIFLFLQFRNIQEYLELITGLVFLGGAVFVFLVMRLIQSTLVLMNKASLSLEEKVSEYRQVSEELRNSRASLESIFNNAIPLCITSKDFEIVRANDAYYDVFGHFAQQPDKQKCFDSRPGGDCHSDSCPLTRIKLGEKEVVCETTKLDSHGRKRYFIITARPFLDANNQTVGIVESFQDISKRKLAEDTKEELIEELQSALEEVNLLSGFLPICASCKKIRDDQGYWNQIESYLRKHSELEFSHGICPDCAQELYPDTYKKIAEKNKKT